MKNQTVKTFTLFALALSAFAFTGHAANYDIKEMTPEIREALAGRQQRYAELQSAKRSGAAQETPQGFVECRTGGSLCSAENHDRGVIYNAIAEQNGLGKAGLSQVQRAFAETIRERG